MLGALYTLIKYYYKIRSFDQQRSNQEITISLVTGKADLGVSFEGRVLQRTLQKNNGRAPQRMQTHN